MVERFLQVVGTTKLDLAQSPRTGVFHPPASRWVASSTPLLSSVSVRGFAPPDQHGKLFLTFDKALPDDAAFTLTLGTTEFDSSDATVSAQTYSWDGGPSWSNREAVTVALAFTIVVFREGTTLLGAFTTPTMPPTLAFEAEMTVGVDGGFLRWI